MAEIKIEKKSPIWPWIIVILIILAAIYFFWAYNDKDLDTDDDVVLRDTISQVEDTYQTELETATIYTGTYGTVKNEHAFADYFKFVDSVNIQSTDKSFYRSGFFKLITATKRQAELDSTNVSTNITAAMESAEKLTNATNPTTKSTDAKKTSEEISKALKEIQKKDYTNLGDEMGKVEEAVSEINANETLDKQSAKIESFFDSTARLLQKMNETNYNQ